MFAEEKQGCEPNGSGRLTALKVTFQDFLTILDLSFQVVEVANFGGSLFHFLFNFVALIEKPLNFMAYLVLLVRSSYSLVTFGGHGVLSLIRQRITREAR